MKRDHSMNNSIGISNILLVITLISIIGTGWMFGKPSSPDQIKKIINTLGKLEIPNSQKEYLEKIYLMMTINEVIAGASEEALKIEKKAEVWAERVRLTSMFFFGKDIPFIDRLKEYQNDIRKMQGIEGISSILKASGRLVQIDSQLRSLNDNIKLFQQDKNLPPSTRNALSTLWGMGQIINWMGGVVPLAGDIIQNYGNFLSGFSVIVRRKYSFLSHRGPAGEINRNDPVVKDFKGMPAETELFLITNRKVLIIKDPNKPGIGGSTAYFIKLNNKWKTMSVSQYQSATSIISDWISAFHEPEGGFWEWVSRKAYDLRKYLKGDEMKVKNTFPDTEIVAEMILNPKKNIRGLGFNRYDLAGKAKQRLQDLADLRVMHSVLGGSRNFNQITLKEFRRKRKWIAENFPKLGITLSPEKEQALLRMIFENTSRFESALRTEAMSKHKGAKQLLQCRGIDPNKLHITELADKLADYRTSLPIERFRITVKDKETGAALENVMITFTMTSACAMIDIRGKPIVRRTENDGSALFVLPFGCYNLRLSLEGYHVKETDKPSCITQKDSKKSIVITLSKTGAEEKKSDGLVISDQYVDDHLNYYSEIQIFGHCLSSLRSYLRYHEIISPKNASIIFAENKTPVFKFGISFKDPNTGKTRKVILELNFAQLKNLSRMLDKEIGIISRNKMNRKFIF